MSFPCFQTNFSFFLFAQWPYQQLTLGMHKLLSTYMFIYLLLLHLFYDYMLIQHPFGTTEQRKRSLWYLVNYQEEETKYLDKATINTLERVFKSVQVQRKESVNQEQTESEARQQPEGDKSSADCPAAPKE
jgi:hypothetical protein